MTQWTMQHPYLTFILLFILLSTVYDVSMKLAGRGRHRSGNRGE